MPSQTKLQSNQCPRWIEEKSEDLSEDAKQYACGILDKAGADASKLPENKVDKLVERARNWEKGTYGEFIEVENQQAGSEE